MRRLGEQREPRKAGAGKWQRVWETLGQWPELPSHTMGISARPAGPGRERRGLCSSGARAGQSRPEQARGKPEPWVCPLFRPTMGAPGSDMPQEPEDLCSIRRPPLTIGQRALSPKSSHFSSSKRDVTAFLRFSKACYTKAALTIGLCTCCSLCLICSSPRFLHG